MEDIQKGKFNWALLGIISLGAALRIASIVRATFNLHNLVLGLECRFFNCPRRAQTRQLIEQLFCCAHT